jgi:ubiquinone/menaquinone biosynthesis C-methylase UbiE
MILYARRKLARKGITNVKFVCDDAAEMGMIQNEQFKFAVVCVCLHGMSLDTRHKVIANCCRLAEKIVLIDYVASFPANITGKLQKIIEALEGKDCYSNFQQWQRLGGIDAFVRGLGLRVEEERPWDDGFGKTVLLTK